MVAASVRLLTLSLTRMCETWALAVLSVMNSRAPTSRLEKPAATRARTSISRSLSPRPRSAAVPGRDGSLNGTATSPAGASLGTECRSIRARRASASKRPARGGEPMSTAQACASFSDGCYRFPWLPDREHRLGLPVARRERPDRAGREGLGRGGPQRRIVPPVDPGEMTLEQRLVTAYRSCVRDAGFVHLTSGLVHVAEEPVRNDPGFVDGLLVTCCPRHLDTCGLGVRARPRPGARSTGAGMTPVGRSRAAAPLKRR